MKAKITKNGVFDQKGKRIAVGTVIEVKGDVLPGYLVNKAVAIEGKRRAVTNPKIEGESAGDIGGAGE